MKLRSFYFFFLYIYINKSRESHAQTQLHLRMYNNKRGRLSEQTFAILLSQVPGC